MSETSLHTQPQELATSRQDDAVLLQLRVPASLCYFEGHFPDCPVLPGVVQLAWAIDYGRRHFQLAPRFVGLTNMKFMRVIVPEKIVKLQLRQRTPGQLTFEYSIGSHVCSTGVVTFAN